MCLERVVKTNKVFMLKVCVCVCVCVCVRGELTWRACESEKFSVSSFGEIFSASQMLPQWTEESAPQIGFALLINWRFCSGADAVDECLSLCTVSVCVCVCVCERERAPSSENQQKEKKKPVINHVNAGWQANSRINGGTYNNNAWKMEQSLSLSFFFSTVLPTKPRLFITLGRCLVASRCMSALGP